MGRVDVRPLVEEAVAAHSVSGEAGYVVRDFEGRVPVDARRFHPGCLAGHVIRHLVLEEDICPAVPVPEDFELLEMLDEQAVGGHVVTVDDDACLRGGARPANSVAMVAAPPPDVVEDRVVAVDVQAPGHAPVPPTPEPDYPAPPHRLTASPALA